MLQKIILAFFFSNRNFSRTALCIWIGWVAFERELKYFLKKKVSSYYGSFVINNNVKIEKWKNEFYTSNDYGSKIDLIASKFLVIIITLIQDYIWLQFQEIIFSFLEKKYFIKKVDFPSFHGNKSKHQSILKFGRDFYIFKLSSLFKKIGQLRPKILKVKTFFFF